MAVGKNHKAKKAIQQLRDSSVKSRPENPVRTCIERDVPLHRINPSSLTLEERSKYEIEARHHYRPYGQIGLGRDASVKFGRS